MQHSINGFTWADGLAVQREQMERWKLLLNSTAYDLLKDLVDARTQAVAQANPNDVGLDNAGVLVPRGTDIDMLLVNEVRRAMQTAQAVREDALQLKPQINQPQSN